MDAGAAKDQKNDIGWTALHEACFYNRMEVVKLLLVHGADATVRTKCGALPYHLCALSVIRNMIKDMGGEDAVPGDNDQIDMVDIMKELTIGNAHSLLLQRMNLTLHFFRYTAETKDACIQH